MDKTFDIPEDEATERRQAELEFVSSAYTQEEAWVENCSSEACPKISRRLLLPQSEQTDSTFEPIEVLLTLTMPKGYPVNEDASIEVNASITSSSSPAMLKVALNSLPGLVDFCRSAAADCAGSEAVFPVLARGDEWVAQEWPEILEGNVMLDKESEVAIHVNESEAGQCNLGRRLIYSHHIIAKTKRKAIGDLGKHYSLGGYFKIGWPGIIIFEGEEEDCISFVDEIRGMRWQHLVVRGEQKIPVEDRSKLESIRVFPNEMVELGEGQMSELAEICRGAGLNDLFLTSMKIYKDNENTKDGKIDQDEGIPEPQARWNYGSLVHLDHWNDKKGYRKWLRKAAEAAGCDLLLKECSSGGKKPIIFVGIMGDKENVRRILKRWRTSRVDVDARGAPCLERMLTVLIEGSLHSSFCASNKSEYVRNMAREEKIRVDSESLGEILCNIGGTEWANALTNLLK
mmetsp:Transcript_1151/g.3111  ORF Transcript_1151/g.3111 Transcript_1151/m.3111 type:complete len:458 (-) Transcript_1151:91-1464(-)|eukprot:CAMPEP_0113547568 /NCGR_PEP_ID=MMETSP0015_2-20120614/12428_1 /TAXON_ID=2838 /ORGANISM="Odontella" /LENGTH=457 /DNA_ID=CAMNT_0000448137 /DNA_START=83 /DNA_END=1456 /DNA_ORIENTATION=- /assembly_acc=CAM_ASM_000160